MKNLPPAVACRNYAENLLASAPYASTGESVGFIQAEIEEALETLESVLQGTMTAGQGILLAHEHITRIEKDFHASLAGIAWSTIHQTLREAA